MPPTRATLKAQGWSDARINAAFEKDLKMEREMENIVLFIEKRAHGRVGMLDILGRI